MSNQPVVALESTIIAHGMPYPENVETALAVERIIRECGATPRTLGILDGEIVVGMSPDQIEQLATRPGVWKCCERDIPLAIARRADAALTAGASISVAARAGIDVFVTGGIGAVGPTASRDFDISADLPAIAEYRVLTVCAGAKAFMDIPATLEWLETHRVPVGVWQSDEFPRFFSRGSGLSTGWNIASAAEAAAVFQARPRGGVLVAAPLPEADALPEDVARAAIATALADAQSAGIHGKSLTPFLLTRIKELTMGRSLTANIALIRNNARIGAGIAKALCA
ncbi:MAG TPA: pseudouridine-5'-phosphate glycosidase [Paludibaculum sp.]|jgi:pseudouridine-5'-phosphate glycosidase